MMDRAVVIGASIAGALCAAVLSRRADEVVVIERDDVSGGSAPRKAVPQGHHVHALYPTGLEVMERLLPGLTDGLVGGGAVLGDPGWDIGWWQYGARRAPVHTGNSGVMCSRPFLEAGLRSRALSLPNVTLITGNVRRLSHIGDSLDGVVLTTDDGLDGDRIPADIVVDCSGRGSRMAAWLTELGYDRPPMQEVGIDIGYATRMFHRPQGERLSDNTIGLLSLADLPVRPRMGVVLPSEGDRWIVLTMGIGNDRPPADVEEFQQRVLAEPAPPLRDLMADAQPLTDVATYRFPTSVRRDFERLRRFPKRLFAAGDTLASFNPVYGQGMTCATRHATALEEHLAAPTWDRSAASYFARAGKTTDAAWSLSVTEDFRLPTTTGTRPRGSSFIHWYGSHYSRGCLTDDELHRRFLEVASMRSAPALMMTPTALMRVGRAGARRRQATATHQPTSPHHEHEPD